jgi:hypothetical protein
VELIFFNLKNASMNNSAELRQEMELVESIAKGYGVKLLERSNSYYDRWLELPDAELKANMQQVGNQHQLFAFLAVVTALRIDVSISAEEGRNSLKIGRTRWENEEA